jgi:5'-nucleotidase
MSKKRPQILVTNDDGITSKGIKTLVKVMQKLGEVIVVAPDSPQSGMGHAITLHEPIKLHDSDIFEDLGVEAYVCSGTPADCVKIAKSAVLPKCNPDLVVSGINHGSNNSINVLYSGTMSAATEGAIEGMASIGFSLCDFSHKADFSHTEKYIEKIAAQVLKKGMPKGVTFNVNFPKRTEEEIKGIRICRQAKAHWEETFEERIDPYGKKYLWLRGEFISHDRTEDTDLWAIDNNYISLVPCLFDLTAYHSLSLLNEDWEDVL